MFYNAVIILILLLIFPYVFSLTEGANGQIKNTVLDQDLKDIQTLLDQKPVQVVEENNYLTSTDNSLKIEVKDLEKQRNDTEIVNKTLLDQAIRLDNLYAENADLKRDLPSYLKIEEQLTEKNKIGLEYFNYIISSNRTAYAAQKNE